MSNIQDFICEKSVMLDREKIKQEEKLGYKNDMGEMRLLVMTYSLK